MRTRFVTTIEDEINKAIKIQAVVEDMDKGELVAKMYSIYIDLLSSGQINLGKELPYLK